MPPDEAVDHTDPKSQAHVESSTGQKPRARASQEAKDFWKILKRQRLHDQDDGNQADHNGGLHNIQSVTRRSQPLNGFVASTTYITPRDGLLVHIKQPEANENGLVIYHNEDWTLIQDLFPKSTVHYLLLPRSADFYRIHPFQAFKDANFLESAKKEIDKALAIAGADLCRKIGGNSAAQQERKNAMLAVDPPDSLPPGRDWKQDFKVGVHSLPSMSHLHIHILSKDNLGSHMKSNHHYNTNNTPFFVNIGEFPLPESDPRWTIVEGQYTSGDVICWRCSTNFGRKFVKLKQHLKVEREDWSKA